MRIFRDAFFKIVGLNSISMVLKILMGVISTKLVSIYLGLQGINTLEFFRNFISVSDTLSQFGIQNGIVKNAALSDNVNKDRKVISTAFFLLITVTVAIVLLSFFFLNTIQNYLFQSLQYEKVIILYLFCLPAVCMQTILIGYLQGKQFFKKVILINCLGYILNIIFSIYLIINFQIIGAMYQIVLVPVVLTLVSFFIFNEKFSFFSYISIKSFDKQIAKSLLDFTFMSLVSSIMVPLSFIIIRNLIQDELGVYNASIWSAIVRLSGFYMLFVSTLCNLYFFPKLIKAVQENQGKEIVNEYFKKFMPVVFIGFLFCFIFQNLIIQLLYTKEFLVINKYFYYQLIADFIKSVYLIFGYFIIAKQKIKHYIFFEVISLAIYLISSKILIDQFGLAGVYYGLIFSFLIYLGITLIYFRKLK